MTYLRHVCMAIVLLFQLSETSAQSTPASIHADANHAVAARQDTAYARHYLANQPGVVIIVVRNGRTVFRKAYGLADMSPALPMAKAMTLRLGSITKQFTAIAILMLADQGKLALLDDIRKFLPDFPTEGNVITVEHLLAHIAARSMTSIPPFCAFRSQCCMRQCAVTAVSATMPETTAAQAASIVLRPFHYEIIKRCAHPTQSFAEERGYCSQRARRPMPAPAETAFAACPSPA